MFKRISREVMQFHYKKIFKSFGKGSVIFSPLKLDGPERINIGDKVYIQYKSWLGAMPLTNSQKCELIIEDGAVIGNFNHIYATSSIKIGKNALLADKVYISDNLHSFHDVRTPVRFQPIIQKAEVTIGEGAWIGECVSIIGASVGKNSVIGANSVVTKDIPDFSVAVGIPAKVIKKYNFDNEKWENVD